MRMPHAVAAVKCIFNSALEAVLPPAMVHGHLRRQGDTLTIGRKAYKLSHNVHVVGFGKAVSGMCRAAQEVLSDHIVDGVLSIPIGTRSTLAKANKSFLLPVDDSKISICEGGANNLPDNNSYQATLKLLKMLKNLTENDIVLTLVSGGGSALLCAPVSPLTLKDKLDVTTVLSKQGASIQELNTIRKALSEVKGGALAKAAYPAQVITLILSDIIGDPLDLIASGPTVQNITTSKDCFKILQKFNMLEQVPESVHKALETTSEPDSNSGNDFSHVQNVLVGTNGVAVNAAVKEARNLGYSSFVLSKEICGEAREVGAFFIDLAILLEKLREKPNNSTENEIQKFLENIRFKWKDDLTAMIQEFHNLPQQKSKICIIGAGETTVLVKGQGKGGRNQEMVLAATIECCHKQSNFPKETKITFLSAGTDGQDGPTDAAGAIFDNCENMPIKSDQDLLDAENSLANNDSYHFFDMCEENILKIGLTGTNVMDLQILTLELI